MSNKNVKTNIIKLEELEKYVENAYNNKECSRQYIIDTVTQTGIDYNNSLLVKAVLALCYFENGDYKSVITTFNNYTDVKRLDSKILLPAYDALIKSHFYLDMKKQEIKSILKVVINEDLYELDQSLRYLVEFELYYCEIQSANEYFEDIYEHLENIYEYLAYCEENLDTFSTLIKTYFLNLKYLTIKGSYDEAISLLKFVKKRIKENHIFAFQKKEHLNDCKKQFNRLRKLKSKKFKNEKMAKSIKVS